MALVGPPDRIRLDGRPVLVAGAGGGGIGTAVCRAVAQAGGIVVAVDLSEDGRRVAAEALAPLGGTASDRPGTAGAGRHLVVDADLAEPGSVEEAVRRAVAEVGPLRGSVHVVGGMRREHWRPLDDDGALSAFDDLLAFNLRPALVSARAVARAMHRDAVTGSIVTIASAAALSAMPFGAGYAAAKSALISLTRTMAVEWGRRGTRVNAVAPGSIRVQRLGRERFDAGEDEAAAAVRTAVPLGRRGEADEVAGAAVFLLSDLASYVNGHTLVVDGGAHCRAPYDDADDLPVFVTDPALRTRLGAGGA